MRFKRLAVIVSIILITLVCYIFMNRNYDPLARYPYQDEKARTLILENLNEKEIKYIIDYDIAPVEFIKYIDNYEFNIYHIDYYKEATPYLVNLTPGQIVTVVERLLSLNFDMDHYLQVFSEYNFEEIMYILVYSR